MQPTCDRCGRKLTLPEATAPREVARITCSCGHANDVEPPAGAEAARDIEPLPAPEQGNFEVDPWQLPPPEGGYVNLVLDEARTGELALAAAARPAGDGSAPSTPERGATVEAAAAPSAILSGARLRSRVLLVAAAAGAVLIAGLAAAIVKARSPRAHAPGERVRVTVTEVPWRTPPPLAPVDPSFREPARPPPSPARPVAIAPAPNRAAAPNPASQPGRHAAEPALARSVPVAVVAAPAPEAEPPAPTPAPAPAIDVAPAPPPPAATAGDVPTTPPPTPAAPASAPAEAVEARSRARAPTLQTRSCVEDALRVPRGLEGRLPREAVVRVDVGEDGRPSAVSAPGLDPRLASALAAAVRTCRFVPGTDAAGRLAALRATMRVRFEP